MKLIKTDIDLRQFLPNAIATVRGEESYLDKLTGYIDAAEQWVEQTFTGPEVMAAMLLLPDSHVMKRCASRLVVAEALVRGLPSLDLVLTPNGFGIVNGSNVAPASRERVERLRDEMKAERDRCISVLLWELRSDHRWPDSEPGRYFGSSLFPTLGITFNPDGQAWDAYPEVRSRVMAIERDIADRWLSTELLNALRAENLTRTATGRRAALLNDLRTHIEQRLLNAPTDWMPLLNFIRAHSEDFPEWVQSAQGRAYDVPVYRNRKESGGFFF